MVCDLVELSPAQKTDTKYTNKWIYCNKLR